MHAISAHFKRAAIILHKNNKNSSTHHGGGAFGRLAWYETSRKTISHRATVRGIVRNKFIGLPWRALVDLNAGYT